MKFTVSSIISGLALLFAIGCGQQNQPPPASAADVNNPLVNAKRTADKTVDTVALNNAIQLFQVQEGRLPKSLEELTPKYIAKLPTPPLGYKLSYDAKKGEVSVVRE